MTETGETYEAEQGAAEPELRSLKDILVRYEIAAASERQARDALVATWRDVTHEALKEIPIEFRLIHQVMDSMDEFLRRSKK